MNKLPITDLTLQKNAWYVWIIIMTILGITKAVFGSSLDVEMDVWTSSPKRRLDNQNHMFEPQRCTCDNRDPQIGVGGWAQSVDAAPSCWKKPAEVVQHLFRKADPGVYPELAEGTSLILILVWPVNALGSPRRNWNAVIGRSTSRKSWWTCCHHDSTPEKQMDGESTIDLNHELFALLAM